jgi:hypothetical protein
MYRSIRCFILDSNLARQGLYIIGRDNMYGVRMPDGAAFFNIWSIIGQNWTV